MTRARRWSVSVVLCATLTPAYAARLPAQGYFGQNQVQYKRFDWKVIETQHFRIHYYPQIAATARIAASMAERSYGRLSHLLQHEFTEKKPIIIFGSRTDFAQNNIFGDLGEGTGGVTDWLRQRNTLYFTGDYGEFEHVLVHEMVHVFQYDIFSRGRAGADLESIARVQPPAWFMEGMAEYLSVGPVHAQTDAVMRDAALNGKVPSVERMSERPDLFFPYRFGESLWRYVAGRWGKDAVGNIMNAVPASGIERAFIRETGLKLDELGEEWRESIQAEKLPSVADHERARLFAEPVLTRRRTGGAVPIYVAPSLSPDGERIAYLSTGNPYRAEVFVDLYLADTKSGKRLHRLTKSTTTSEYEELRTGYSQSAFSPDGRYLAFTAQRRGRDIMVLMDVETRREVRSYNRLPFEQMIGPTFSPDGQQIAFIGSTGEQSDLYMMQLDGSGLRRLTNDLYGDAQPSWSPDGRHIAFASERGPQTDMDLIRFGKWRISVLDLASGDVEVLPGQAGRNINPQWSPDSRSIAYVSDRSGTANIYLYDLEDGLHYQLTNVYTSIASFTEVSPAISWARRADKLAFVYFEDGDYSIWWIDNPRRLKKEPLPLTRDSSATTLVAGSDNASVTLQASGVVLDSLPERRSVYRSAQGLRPSGSLSTAETATSGSSVMALLDRASLALPDTTSFNYHDYRPSFTPEYVAQPTIGYAQSNYGRGVFGGAQVVMSDLLANERMAFAGAINGRVSEAQLFAAYANYSHRFQYFTGISQAPYFWLGGGGYETRPDGSVSAQQLVNRYIMREAFGTALLPRDRFSRWEFGGRLTMLRKDTLLIDQSFDTFGRLLSYDYKVRKAGGAKMVAPYVAYVHDNSLMGNTAPLLGRRYRFQVTPTVGDWRWVEYLVDYRRYDAILFNVLTLATRVQGVARVGRNEGEFQEVLQPEFVRGYDRQLYYRRSCSAGTEVGCVDYDDLIGSRVAFANAELRFPIARRLEFGFIPFALPPIDGHVFYDAGVAWNAGQKVDFSGRTDATAGNRSVLRSWGAGARINLFGFAILRLDYAIPIVQGTRRGYWTWMLGGYGF